MMGFQFMKEFMQRARVGALGTHPLPQTVLTSLHREALNETDNYS